MYRPCINNTLLVTLCVLYTRVHTCIASRMLSVLLLLVYSVKLVHVRVHRDHREDDLAIAKEVVSPTTYYKAKFFRFTSM